MTKKIVCIMNSAETYSLIRSSFLALHIETVLYTSGIDFLCSLNREKADLIILDGTIHDIESSLVIDIVKKQYATPIIAVVSNSGDIVSMKGVDQIIVYSKKFFPVLVQVSCKLLKSGVKKEAVNDTLLDDSEILQSVITLLHRKQIGIQLYEKLVMAVTGIVDYQLTLENIGVVIFEYFSIDSLVFANYKGNSVQYYSIVKNKETLDGVFESFHTHAVKTFCLSPEINIHNEIIKIDTITKTYSDGMCNQYYFPQWKNFKSGFCYSHTMQDSEELAVFNSVLPFLFKIFCFIIEYKNNMYTAEKLKLLFSHFLPVKVIDDLLKKTDIKSLMTGEKREVAVIFSHIRDFSYIEHNNNPEELVAFLNEHFTGLTQCIKKYGGEINKFIGDAVFAMFGAPESYIDNEKRACLAALEMSAYVRNAQKTINFPENGYRIGVGIHIGKAIIGNIGSSDNFDYTAIGDTVNLAARLESLNKHYNTGILVSENIYQGCIMDDFVFREADTVMVKGKDKPTTMYSLVSDDEFDQKFFALYKKGIKMFKIGNFIFARDFFLECLQLKPDDIIVGMYCSRCDSFIANPPENWTGSIVLDFK